MMWCREAIKLPFFIPGINISFFPMNFMNWAKMHRRVDTNYSKETTITEMGKCTVADKVGMDQ